MAKLYFNYSSMNAGKSTALLQADYNYRERGMTTILFTSSKDERYGKNEIVSRIGISAPAAYFLKIPIYMKLSLKNLKKNLLIVF